MAQYLGIVDLVWKGLSIKVEAGSKVLIGGLQNKEVITARAVGRAQEFKPSSIEATTVLERGQRATEIYSEGEGELQVSCDTGQTLVFADAFLTERGDMTGGEGGKITLKWSAGEPEEIIE